MVNFVDERSDLPKDNHYVYHSTKQRNLDSILENGLKSSYRDPEYETLNRLLETVAQREEIQSVPDSRADCVFTFPRFSDIVGREHDCIVAIDLSCLNCRIYRGSYSTISEIFSVLSEKNTNDVKDIIDTKEIDKKSDHVYKLCVKYLENLNRETSPINKGGEVLVTSDVHTSCITHVYE